MKSFPFPPLVASPLTRFFAISLAFHLLVFFGLLPKPGIRSRTPDPVVVSLAPELAPQPKRAPASTPPPKSTQVPKNAQIEKSSRSEKSSRAEKNQARMAPVKIAKNDAPQTRAEGAARPETKTKTAPAKEPPPQQIAKAEEPPRTPEARPSTREEFPERAIVTERELPTLKQLLPPLSQATDGGGVRSRVPLETKDPQYISYFTAIKRSIDANWKYPELALRYGLQGRLIVEFEILESGQLEGLRLIRSSGSALLDDEAMRAIRSAAPFAPIPRWIEQRPLPITARMEYHDGRLSRPIP